MLHRLRHFAAIALLGALSLQVTFLGSGFACALQTGASADVAVADTSGATAHGGHAAHGGARPEAPGTEQGSSQPREHAPAHCPASMTCSVVGLLTTVDVSPVDGLPRTSEMPASDDVAPASLRGAPEPPPPRA
jgi:hypothetical protein